MDSNKYFFIGDKVKLSKKCNKWRSYCGGAFWKLDNLKRGEVYEINNSVFDNTKEKNQFVDVKEGTLIYPAWCFELVERGGSDKYEMDYKTIKIDDNIEIWYD